TENQTIIENAYFTRVTDEIKGKSWYKAAVAASGRPIWVIKNSETLDSQTLALVRALFNRTTGTLTGVLALHLDNRKIEQLVNAHKDQTIVLVDGKVAFSSRPFAFREKLSLSTGLNIGEFKSDNILWGKDRSLTMLYGLYHEYGNSITLAQIIPHKDLESATNFIVLLCVLLMAGCSILSLSLLQIFTRYMAKRVSYLQMQINRIVQNNFELGPRLSGSDEFAEIYDALMATSNNIKTLIDEVYRHKIQREQLLARQNDIRFKMLSNQINPHFLFNSLETIRMQAIEDDNKEVAKTIKLLAKILRHNLSVSNNPVSLKAEIEAVDNYLAIQHLRFADRVKYSIDIHTDISDAVILPLLIQPLVENSFSHGLQDRKIGGLIEISIDTCKDGKVFQISIKDNGCGITKEELAKLKSRLATGTVENFSSSIGMVNVNQRIKLFYGQDYGLEIESEIEKGTLVTIKIPAEFNSDGGKNV
ncbi:MAG: sensor histidine kinase, partial [Treponema sp.]|nr:sensor histidine kinase [Treponema sp.]